MRCRMSFSPATALLVRMEDDLGQVIPTLRRTLLSMGPGLRYAQIRKLTELVDPQARGAASTVSCELRGVHALPSSFRHKRQRPRE